MKNQALFSSKDESKKLKCRLLQLLFGALRVNCFIKPYFHRYRNAYKNRTMISYRTQAVGQISVCYC